MLTRYLIKALLARATSNLVAVLSIGITVGACVLSLAFYHGLRDNLAATGREDNLEVLSLGVLSPSKSFLAKEMLDQIKVMPEVAQEGGQSLVSPEMHVDLGLGDGVASVPMRGIEPVAFRLHDQVKIEEGRAPEVGAPELIIGRKLLNRSPEMRLGGTVKVRGNPWTVVGVFSAEKSALEGEVWADRSRLVTDSKLGTVLSAVVRVRSLDGVEALAEKIGKTRLAAAGSGAWALSERKFYESTIGNVELVQQAVAAIILVLLLGAVFAAANTLHASLMAKLADYATLWLLGFRRSQLVRLVFQESLIIVAAAAVLACALSAAVAGIQVTEIMGGEVEFALPFGLRQLGDAAGLACAIGAMSAVYPAIVVLRGNLYEAIQ